MLRKVDTLRQMWRHFGPDWLAFRVRYAARLRIGALRRQLPVAEWKRQPLYKFLNDPGLAEPERYLAYRRDGARSFFFKPSDLQTYREYFGGWDNEHSSPLIEAADLAQGRLRYFEHAVGDIGFPPEWHLNPFNQQTVSPDLHWSQISDFGESDIKIIWEPSRFGFVYALVRSYWRTEDNHFAELFWQLVEDWRERNPPQKGPNWKCGQETSFRVMAWCFGLYGFLNAPATSASRVAALAQMIAVSGERIAANLNYALNQRNNHGISEAVGLWTIGLLFPEFSSSDKWREIGARALEEQGLDLIYEDGAFAQHSVNYHRLMLHDYLWAFRLGDLYNRPFSSQLKERVKKAGDFLFEIQDEESGHVPCYGQNDGALILPLNNCDYQDFRPVIQAAQCFSTGSRCYTGGPWDEDLLWLFGTDAVNAPVVEPERDDLRAEAGGYYTLRSETGFAFIRCATFRDRPGQADMLHVDLWWRGQNVAIDAGTYSYNARPPWNNSLTHTAYHNTVTVDNLDQMERAGKFLWLPWLHSRVRYDKRSDGGHLSYWEGEHDGYQRLKAPVNHRRAILRLDSEWWLIMDRLNSRADHLYRLHWLLPDVPHDWQEGKRNLTLHTPAGHYCLQLATSSDTAAYSLARADADTPRGWRSPYYNYREPALSVSVAAEADSLLFASLFGPGLCDLVVSGTTLEARTEQWETTIHINNDGPEQLPLIASVTVAGHLQDSLELS